MKQPRIQPIINRDYWAIMQYIGAYWTKRLTGKNPTFSPPQKRDPFANRRTYLIELWTKRGEIYPRAMLIFNPAKYDLVDILNQLEQAEVWHGSPMDAYEFEGDRIVSCIPCGRRDKPYPRWTTYAIKIDGPSRPNDGFLTVFPRHINEKMNGLFYGIDVHYLFGHVLLGFDDDNPPPIPFEFVYHQTQTGNFILIDSLN